MDFIKERISLFSSNKRMSSPRDWSPNDHYFYRQSIRRAQYIDYVPSSIAYIIAELVRDTSVLRSDWKKVAWSLGINDEGQLKNIEDAARWKQELPLYIALTTQYMINPAASLGGLLDSLMKLKRYDILIKIKDDVQDAIHKHNGLRITKSSIISQQKLKNEPVEEESVECLGHKNMIQDRTAKYNKSKTTASHSVNSSCSNSLHKPSENEINYNSAFYDRHSPPNSFLEILSNNNDTDQNDYSFDCCHSTYERDMHDKKPNLIDRYQNKENLVGNKMLSVRKLDSAGITDFQFIDPTNKSQRLITNINEIELNSVNSNSHLEKIIESEMVAETSLPSTAYSPSNVQENESVRSNNNTPEDHYDSDTTCDEDFDINLTEQAFGTTSLCSQNTELYSRTLSIDNDGRRKENERRQYLSISEYERPESPEIEDQCSGTESESYDLNNSVNERIEGWVAKKDESLRNVERAERESISAFLLPLKIQETLKNPHDEFLSLVTSVLPSDRSIDVDVSIKVIIVHSEKDSHTALAIASALVKESNIAAVAECQLSPIWLLDPSRYRRIALHWTDVIIPLITNTWLEDINNEKPLMEREVASLNARAVFRLLQNMFVNRGSVNLSAIPVVLEGTSRRFMNYPEIRDAVKLTSNFNTDESIKKLGDLIKGFHRITRDAKKALLE